MQSYESKRRKTAEGLDTARSGTFTRAHHSQGVDQRDRVRSEEIAKRFDGVLRAQIHAWTKQLLKLQPKVHMSAHIIDCGLCIFKRLRRAQLLSWSRGNLPKAYISNKELMIHDLIACWWIAMKHCSVRTAVPNRTLLSRATHAKEVLLGDCEIAALVALNWDINAILVESGMVEWKEDVI